eukprot:Cvel_19829.t1-p1 / transcript=Cvel_19829.t1 / gene=Cvel_19829 / organism=Chromera_velia_CCMP2878 / gene_product=hypothetical protein / transcript_product=hypothetical protein / location=Cvel_scaffold1736:774-4887(-) / protein_length=299 / sequence_SO=supercontig / SO=protein_coding / is_pseudo=false
MSSFTTANHEKREQGLASFTGQAEGRSLLMSRILIAFLVFTLAVLCQRATASLPKAVRPPEFFSSFVLGAFLCFCREKFLAFFPNAAATTIKKLSEENHHTAHFYIWAAGGASKLPLAVVLVVSTILAPTEPLGTFSLGLQRLEPKVPERVSLLTEVEALVAAPVATLLYFIFLTYVTKYEDDDIGFLDGIELAFYYLVIPFFAGLLAAFMIGSLVSLLNSSTKLSKSPLAVALVVCGTWGLFYFASKMGVSTWLAYTGYGLYFARRGRVKMTRFIQEQHDAVVEFLEVLVQQIFFIWA